MMLRSSPVSRSCSVHSRAHRAPLVFARATAAAVDVAPSKVEKKEAEVKPEQPELPDVEVSTKEVQGFLNNLVSNTNIAELHLQVGSFELKVRRSTGAPAAVAAPVAAPAPAAPAYNGPQVIVTKAPPAELTLEQTVDETLVTITAPKVGVFRRGKYAGGKRVGKGNCANTGDQVKRGQVLGYVEQLGTFVAVEAPQAGEVVKFVVEDGAPVEYKQDVCELSPFFGGHIIGDSKYA